MKKVLIASLAFPPLPLVGVYRVSKFCKYLPENGWKPYVLTEKIRDVRLEKDWALLKEIEEKTTIIRTTNFQPFYWWDNRRQNNPESKIKPSVNIKKPNEPAELQEAQLRVTPKNILKNSFQLLRKILTVPDARLTWIPQAILPGLRIIFREKIDIILSSSPPPTNHIMGYLLSIFSGRPHVVDYRDLWTQNGGYFMRNLPGYLQKYDTFLERKILKHCQGVVFATNTFRDKMMSKFGDTGISNKISVIYNGVDESNYLNIDMKPFKNDCFTINYFGNLYGFRNPSLFINALLEWFENNPEIKQKVKVNFWGAHSEEYITDTFRHDLKGVVSFIDRIPQQEVIQKMFQTDLLLLIQGLDPRIDDAIPTKLFEYMVTGKPILAFFPEGEAANILLEQKKHLIISHPDENKIVTFLKHQFDLWKNNPECRNIGGAIPTQFNRRNQTQQLSNFMENLIKS